MTTKIQETLDRLRELDRVTAPAPWGSTYSGCLETIDYGGMVIKDAEGGTVAEADVDFGHHWFFIDGALPLMVDLRNALPDLLAEIDRLTAENKKLEGSWEDGYKFAANLYYDDLSEPDDFAQEARLNSPYQENKK